VSEPAVRVAGLRATVDPGGEVTVLGGAVRLTPAGLERLLPPGAPVRVAGITRGRVLLRGHWNGLPVAAEVLPEGTPEGRLRLRLTAVKAGVLPLPPDLVAGALLGQVPAAPGLHRVGNTLEIDLAAAARPLRLALPVLARVAVGEGWVEGGFAQSAA